MSNTHLIKSGENLNRIAKQYGTTVAALQAANNMGPKETLIRAGKTLNLPGQTSSGGGGNYPTTLGSGVTYTLPGTVDLGGGGWTAGMGGKSGAAGQAGYPGTPAYTPTNLTHAGTGKQLVDMTGHTPGYSGLGYFDDRGRAYTDYGAYLRTDNFEYPTGATISPNGMYYDVGNGWQYAGMATAKNKYAPAYSTPSEVYGLAPGTSLHYFDGALNGGGGGYSAAGSGGGGNGSSGGTGGADGAGSGTTPSAEELQAMLNLLEYTYFHHIQDDWEDYSQGNRTDY